MSSNRCNDCGCRVTPDNSYDKLKKREWKQRKEDDDEEVVLLCLDCHREDEYFNGDNCP